MRAINKLFERLRRYLPDERVDELAAQYRKDAAEDARDSRQREKKRQDRAQQRRADRQP